MEAKSASRPRIPAWENNIRQDFHVALNKPDKETLDRWHRNEGKAEPPRRGPGAPRATRTGCVTASSPTVA